MNKTLNIRIVLLFSFFFVLLSATAKDEKKYRVLDNVFNYKSHIDSLCLAEDTVSKDTLLYNNIANTSFAYTKFTLNVHRRNALLMCIPTMYAIAHGGARSYATEHYTLVNDLGNGSFKTRRLLNITTIPHRRNAMEISFNYLMPHIYNTTIFDNNMLSPFNRENKMFYKYKIVSLTKDRALLSIKSKLRNTQLFDRATALVETTTGKIIETELAGEFDMITFHLIIRMNSMGRESLYPTECNLTTRFSLLGNKISGKYVSIYNLPKVLPDSVINSIENSDDTLLMQRVRPVALNENENNIITSYYAKKSLDSTSRKQSKRNWAKSILWEQIGENLLTHVKGNYGTNEQGNYKVSPLINPLYFGYSHSKGITYKFNVRTSYTFSQKSDISARLKLGYSFKQHQLYYKIPITYCWNRKKNGYIELEIGNGNHIREDKIAQEIERQKHRPMPDADDIATFKDFYSKEFVNYDLNHLFSFGAGWVSHERKAVYPKEVTSLDLRPTYRSVAPKLELKYRPTGYNGPVITLDYERSIKGLCRSNINYERWEADGQWKLHLRHLKTLSMRVGTGLYTDKGDKRYFLDYTNFRRENLVNGWNDEWTGEFELLRSNVYNSSSYYIRSNLTYESPVLALSWLPLIGRYFEMERIYVSTLKVANIRYYTEVGYGFSTRVLSAAVFANNKDGKFSEVGVKLALELFRDW